MKNKKVDYCYIVIILFIILSLGICTILSPKKEKSDLENRNLSVLPVFSISSILSGDYFNQIESYYIDHFYSRDKIIDAINTAKSTLKLYDYNDIIFGKNNVLLRKSEFEDYVSKSLDSNGYLVAKALKSLQNSAETYGGNVYYMHIKYHNEFFLDCLPNIYNVDYYKSIYNQYNNDLLSEVSKVGINIIDTSLTLGNHSNENIYFKTDHHWTFKGAYYAYTDFLKAICNNEGVDIEIPSWDDMELYKSNKKFLGSISNLLGSTKYIDTDCFEYALPKDYPEYTRVTNGKINNDELFDLSNEYDKYDNIMGYNKATDDIYTNQDIDRNILIIGYSYKRALQPLAAYNFKNVYGLDPRYFKGNVNDYIKKIKPDYILVVRDDFYEGNSENVCKID